MDGLSGKSAVWEILASRHDLETIAALACRREGFTDANLGAGVSYHHEIEQLAKFDDLADGDNIPTSHVQVFAGWGMPDGVAVVVPEAEYLTTLASILIWRGFAADAAKVSQLLDKNSA